MKNKRGLKSNCKGIISDYLPWLLIALAILVIMMIGAFVLKGKGFEFIDKILSLFKGG
jgi:hypothetical protein